MDPFKIIAAASEILSLAAARNYAGVAKRAVELGLDLVPVDELKGYLDQAAVDRINAVVDEVERAAVRG